MTLLINNLFPVFSRIKMEDLKQPSKAEENSKIIMINLDQALVF